MSKFIEIEHGSGAPSFINSSEIVKWDADRERATLKSGNEVRIDPYDVAAIFWGDHLPTFSLNYDLYEAYIQDTSGSGASKTIYLFDVEDQKVGARLVAPRGAYAVYAGEQGYGVNLEGRIKPLYSPMNVVDISNERGSVFFLANTNIMQTHNVKSVIMSSQVVGNAYTASFQEFVDDELKKHYMQFEQAWRRHKEPKVT